MSERNIVPGGRRRLRTVALVFAIGVAGFLVLLILTAWFFGIESEQDVLTYRAMMHDGYHPIWKDLALRRIRKGDTVGKLVKRHAPSSYPQSFGSYTLLTYRDKPLCGTINIAARNGKLLFARVRSRDWARTFFGTLADETAFMKARRAAAEQRKRQKNAYALHRAITTDQDVFLANSVERREVTATTSSDARTLDALKKIYGDKIFESQLFLRTEWAVEVGEVLYGDVTPGTVLHFLPSTNEPDINDVLFIYFENNYLLYPRARNAPKKPAALIVPKAALDWYRTLTNEQREALHP